MMRNDIHCIDSVLMRRFIGLEKHLKNRDQETEPGTESWPHLRGNAKITGALDCKLVTKGVAGSGVEKSTLSSN